MTRVEPLPADANPDLKDTLQVYQKYLGYVPNSVLIMQHRPKLVKALAQMASAVWDKDTSGLFERMKRHWTAPQIVEIAGAVALNGFLNRWNDTMAVPLEPEPIEFGEKHLKRHGWKVGKHRE